MTTEQKTALVNAHWGYIASLIGAYNLHIGALEQCNLAWIEADYKSAMMAGLNGQDCPVCLYYPASKFQVFNISSAWIHGKKHRDEMKNAS